MIDPFFNKQTIRKYSKSIDNGLYTIEYYFIAGKLVDVEIKIEKGGNNPVRLYFGSEKEFDEFLELLGITEKDAKEEK